MRNRISTWESWHDPTEPLTPAMAKFMGTMAPDDPGKWLKTLHEQKNNGDMEAFDLWVELGFFLNYNNNEIADYFIRLSRVATGGKTKQPK